MADQTSELSIVIEAINNASEQIKQVEKDLGGLGDAAKKPAEAFVSLGEKQGEAIRAYQQYLKEFDQSTDQLNADLSGLTASAQNTADSIGGISMASVTAALKLVGITLAVKELISQLSKAVDVAGQMETSLLGISATARMFGEDAKRARDASKSLTEDGLLNQIEAAEGLQEIMYTGLGMKESIELMERFKDMAAFGGKNTIEFDDKIRMLFESFRTGYSVQAKNAGLMMTWNQVMEIGAKQLGKTTDELTLAEQAQAKYLGVMEMTAGETKQAAIYADTYAGSVRALENAQVELQNQIGRALLPAMKLFNEAIVKTEKGLSAVRIAAGAVASVFLGLQLVARQVGNYISGMVAIIINDWRILAEEASRITLDPRSWLEAGRSAFQRFQTESKDIWGVVKDDALQIAYDTQVALKKTWDTGFDDVTRGIQEAGNDWLNAQSEATRRMNEDLEKENRNYIKAVAKRTKQFEESFDDLVMAHRDAIKKLTDDLTKENKDYNKKVKELENDYKKAVESMAKSHKDKTESVLEDIEDERKKTLEAIEEITEKYNEERTLVEREGEARLSDLQTQLDRELALGDKANQEKVDALRRMIQYEKDGLAISLEEQKAKYDEQIDDENERLNEKLTKLQANLDKETRLYEEALAERKATYDQDVANAKESYEERRLALQTELDNEVAIRERYAEDFARIGDRMAEDDLTRLKRKFNEELAEMKVNHEERLAEIKGGHEDELKLIEQSRFEQGKASVEKFTAGMQQSYPQFKKQVDQMKNDLDNIACKTDMYTSGMFNFTSVGVGQGGGGGGGSAWQRGGLVTRPTFGVVGEAGAEAVLPLSNPKRMEEILRSIGKSQSKKEVIQNFYVTVNNPQDVDVLMERAGFAYQSQGGLN